MARGRMISKSLGTSERFAKLFEVAPDLAEFAQSLYPLLVTHADDFGRQAADLFTIKHRVHPASPRGLCDFKQALIALHNVGLIIWYENGNAGGKCLQIQQFDKHQFGLHKRTRSEFPRPPSEASGNFREFPGSTGTTELNRTELNRREEKRDLASSEDLDVLPDPASTRIPTRARASEPPTRWTPESTPTTTVIATAALPRPGHSTCYPSDACWHGLCIPRKLGEEWTGQWRDPKDAAVIIAAIVKDTIANKPNGGVGASGYEFWRAVWKYHHGGIPLQANTRESRILEAGRRTQAAIDRGEL